MTLNTKIALALSALALTICALFAVAFAVRADIGFTAQPEHDAYKINTLLAATSSNATSTNSAATGGYALLVGAKRAELYVTHGGVATTSTGTSTVRVQVTPDGGTTWVDYGKLTQATSTNQQPTVLAGPATSTQVFGVDLRTDAFQGIRCITLYQGAAGASGELTCAVAVEF